MEAALVNLTSKIDKLVSRLESVEKQLSQGPPHVATSSATSTPVATSNSCCEVSPAQREFDELISAQIKPLVPMSKEIGAALGEQMEVFLKACEECSRLIGVASRSKKPSQADLPKIIEPLSKLIGEIAAFKDKNGRAKEFNNIAGVAEGAPAFGWVAVEPTPAPYMNDIIPGSEFYTNKVLVAFKGKDENQVKWAKEFNSFLKNMQSYVKRSHTTGLAWNPNGGNALENASKVCTSSGDDDTPCPPPPPPAGFFDDVSKAPVKEEKKPDFLSALQQGTEISKALKHVKAEQKNKNLSAEEKEKLALKPKEKAPQETKAKTAVPTKVRPPKNELSGNKWFIENQVGQQITIDETKKDMAFYIGNCKDTTVVIKGKINSITVDGCNKCGVVVDTTVSVIEIVNSNSCQLQVTDKTPCVNIDKCGAIQVYLPASACNSEAPTDVYTSKCSAVNVLIPGETPDSDMVELPIPEQFVTHVVNGKLVTECSSHV